MLLCFEYVDRWLLIVTFQMLYPSINLDEVNEAHSRGLELVKEEIFQQLEITKLDTAELDKVKSWSPPACLADPHNLIVALEDGAWDTAYRRYHSWQSELKKKPYNVASGRSQTSHGRASRGIGGENIE